MARLEEKWNKSLTMKEENFAMYRLDWTTLKNIDQMYDIIYDEMVVAKVAEKLIIPIDSDNKRNEVKNVVDAFCKSKKLIQCSPIKAMFCLQMSHGAIPIRRMMGTLLTPNTSQRKELEHKECLLLPMDASLPFPSLLLMASQCGVL